MSHPPDGRRVAHGHPDSRSLPDRRHLSFDDRYPLWAARSLSSHTELARQRSEPQWLAHRRLWSAFRDPYFSASFHQTEATFQSA